MKVTATFVEVAIETAVPSSGDVIAIAGPPSIVSAPMLELQASGVSAVVTRSTASRGG